MGRSTLIYEGDSKDDTLESMFKTKLRDSEQLKTIFAAAHA